MTTLQLACRVYAINPEVRNDITELLIKSAPNKPRSYDVYHTEEQDIDLAIVILRRFDNSYGTNITVSIDQILNLYHREEHEKPVRYSKEYEIQFLSEKNEFKNHIIIFAVIAHSNFLKATL